MTNYQNLSFTTDPGGIAAGSDGALWFTSESGSLGRLTTSGTFARYLTDLVPWAVTAGPDGSVWFTIFDHNAIGRITTPVTPQISDTSKASGPAGTQVTITGTNLGGATAVAFNGTPAPILSDSATSLATQVPAGATSGPLTITTPAGTATSKRNFTVRP